MKGEIKRKRKEKKWKLRENGKGGGGVFGSFLECGGKFHVVEYNLLMGRVYRLD